MKHAVYSTEKPLMLFILAIVVSSYVILAWDPEVFRHTWVTEDGPVEWLTAGVLLLICLLAIHHFVVAKASQQFRAQVFYGLTAGAMFFAFGEEISWGQRIFNFSTPEFFMQHNAQQEANLHNLKVFGVKLNKTLFAKGSMIGAAIYLLVIPYLYKRSERVQKWIKTYAIPLAKKRQILFFIMLVIAIELMPTSKKGEVLECAGILMLLLIFLNPDNQIFDSKDSQEPLA